MGASDAKICTVTVFTKDFRHLILDKLTFESFNSGDKVRMAPYEREVLREGEGAELECKDTADENFCYVRTWVGLTSQTSEVPCDTTWTFIYKP